MGRRGVVIGLLAGTAAFGAGGCGPGYRSEEPRRMPETCSGADAVPDCAERLERYERELREVLPGLMPSAQATTGHEVSPSVESEAAPSPPASAPTQAYVLSEASDAAGEEAEPSSEREGPDCSAGRDLRDRICELADAICGLAGRPDAAEQTVNTCKSATASCTRARDQVAAACP